MENRCGYCRYKEALATPAGQTQHGLRAGDLGTVVLVHQDGKGYTVEFETLGGDTLGGDTLAVVTLSAEQIRPTRANDIAHMREVAPAS